MTGVRMQSEIIVASKHGVASTGPINELHELDDTYVGTRDTWYGRLSFTIEKKHTIEVKEWEKRKVVPLCEQCAAAEIDHPSST